MKYRKLPAFIILVVGVILTLLSCAGLAAGSVNASDSGDAPVAPPIVDPTLMRVAMYCSIFIGAVIVCGALWALIRKEDHLHGKILLVLVLLMGVDCILVPVGYGVTVGRLIASLDHVHAVALKALDVAEASLGSTKKDRDASAENAAAAQKAAQEAQEAAKELQHVVKDLKAFEDRLAKLEDRLKQEPDRDMNARLSALEARLKALEVRLGENREGEGKGEGQGTLREQLDQLKRDLRNQGLNVH